MLDARPKRIAAFLLLMVVLNPAQHLYAGQDIVIDGVYEAALDLPRIYFLLRRTKNGPPIKNQDGFEPSNAFLDTGASGILLSRETAEQLSIGIDPKAAFADIGVGGEEFFNVSEPLYLGLAGYETAQPNNEKAYRTLGPARFQVKKNSASLLSEPINIVGMPVMAGRVIVLNSGATNSLEYFAADIKNPGDPAIPKVDFELAIRFESFADARNPRNIPPLPIMARNPVIDKITLNRKGKISQGTWLFDTGATISFISTAQAKKLGIMDKDGKPLVKEDFSLPIGGIGQMTTISGFQIDSMTLPTASGKKLIFKNVRIGVHDIKYTDPNSGKTVILDGVLGSNFLCSSAKMEGILPSDVNKTPFDRVVIDMQKGRLGFKLRDDYRLH